MWKPCVAWAAWASLIWQNDFGHKHKVWYEGCPIGEFGYDCCSGDVYLMSSSLKIKLIDSEIKHLQELKERLQ